MALTSTVRKSTSTAGESLHAVKWVPNGELRALLYVTHGVGEHMGRYTELVEVLTHNGILVFGHDQVGHGKSEGDRAHINSFRIYYDDVIQHVEDTKAEYPGVPCFLAGHSNGGLIALHVAVSKQDLFTGLILSSPSAQVDPKVAGPFTQALAHLVGSFIPQWGIKSIDPSSISSVDNEVQRYIDDPLIHHENLKAKWGSEALSAIKEIRENVTKITLPLLIFHGTDDSLVPFSASEFVFANISSSNKTFERFEGSRHEILHDKDQQRARDMIKDWILSQINLQA